MTNKPKFNQNLPFSLLLSKAVDAAKNGNQHLALEFLNFAEDRLVSKSFSRESREYKLIRTIRAKYSLNESKKIHKSDSADFAVPEKVKSLAINTSSAVDHTIEFENYEVRNTDSQTAEINLEQIIALYDGNKYQKIAFKEYDYLLEGNLESVSIVIPVFNRSKILGMTLAALTHQTYPKHLIEVVVVDDGSHENTMDIIRRFDGLLNISYFWQADKGYRPGQARTAGMCLAQTENIITLDCDMLPTRNLVAEYMFILNRKKDRVLVGPRKYVSTDHLIVEDLISTPYWIDTLPEVITNNSVATGKYMNKKTVDWRHAFFKRTDFLRNSIFPFIAFASGNVAYSKRAFKITGGYDPEFEKWGSEDTEFAYRLFTEGFYFEPVMNALAFHQEPPGGENEVDRATGYTSTKEILKEKCPLFSRDYVEGKTYRIPKYCLINAGLSEEIFNSIVSGYKYSDLEIDRSNLAKLIAEKNPINLSLLEEFLKNIKSPFIILIKEFNEINIPFLVDEEMKRPDVDLQVLLIKINKIIDGKAMIFWRGAIARFLNFKNGKIGDL